MKYINRESHIIPQLKKIPFKETMDVESPEEGLKWIYWVSEKLPFRISVARIQQVSQDVLALFKGYLPSYLPCDTRYHDLGHTLRLLPPFCQLAVALSKKHPETILPRDLELGLIAVFLHDSGYIRKKGDCSGTGAKYTFRHISRSVDFAGRYLTCLGYREQDLIRVEHMINCTGVKPKLKQINFVSKGCRLLGYALGTSDFLSQMADPRYLDKLPLLFLEFQEAYNYEGPEQLQEMEIQPFKSCEDLIQNTPFFFEKVVRKRLEDMGKVYLLLIDPEAGTNPYLEKIQEHMKKIAQRYSPM
jgi:hypothetical protein